MTIAAGFCVRDGVLICADTEHSGLPVNTHESKVIISPQMNIGRVVFSYAGIVPLAKTTIQRIIEDLYAQPSGSLTTPASIAAQIEQTLHAQYEKHVSTNPDTNIPSVYQLIFGIQCPHQRARLYATWKGAVTELDLYGVLGMGEYIGNYVLGSLIHANMKTEHVHAVACYAMAKAKRLADGVGGLTHTVLLKHDGSVETIPTARTMMRELAINGFDNDIQELFLHLISDSDAGFLQYLSGFNEIMKQVRTMGMFNDETREDPNALVVTATTQQFPSIQSLPGPTIHDPSGQQP